MTVYAPGCAQSQFKNRQAKNLRCICEERGDWNVFVDGQGPYCIIIDREYNKVEFEDMGVNTSSIEAIWLEDDCIPIRKNSELISGDDKFKVKESPVSQYDGWITVKLKLTCEC